MSSSPFSRLVIGTTIGFGLLLSARDGLDQKDSSPTTGKSRQLFLDEMAPVSVYHQGAPEASYEFTLKDLRDFVAEDAASPAQIIARKMWQLPGGQDLEHDQTGYGKFYRWVARQDRAAEHEKALPVFYALAKAICDDDSATDVRITLHDKPSDAFQMQPDGECNGFAGYIADITHSNDSHVQLQIQTCDAPIHTDRSLEYFREMEASYRLRRENQKVLVAPQKTPTPALPMAVATVNKSPTI